MRTLVWNRRDECGSTSSARAHTSLRWERSHRLHGTHPPIVDWRTDMARILAAAGAAAALFGALLVPHVASADTAPAESAPGATVSLDSVNGSGCPAGSARVAATPDGRSINVLYSEYLVWAGQGSDVTEQRKNCFLSIDVDVPDGYTYAITGLQYQGFAELAQGATGLQQAQYYFQGQSRTTTVTHDFSGPYDGSLDRRDSIPQGDQIWAPCGGDVNLNVNTELRVNPGSSTGEPSVMAMHSTQVPGTTLSMSVKPC
ncbi:DUF4360 domain-containing protein [Streptomyces sp. 4N509B]|uniref:DUF4360 domain-containing protein n=1 Tax=Streptomyces sp. 4N509B TaxID=3457413 RepID=UPI003FD0A8A4